MYFKDYIPTFRNVVFREIREEKTKGGIFLPPSDFVVKTHADMFDNEKEHKADKKIGEYQVLKVGKDCTEVKPGDYVILMEGIRPTIIGFHDGDYLQVPEMQIIGYERKNN